MIIFIGTPFRDINHHYFVWCTHVICFFSGYVNVLQTVLLLIIYSAQRLLHIFFLMMLVLPEACCQVEKSFYGCEDAARSPDVWDLAARVVYCGVFFSHPVSHAGLQAMARAGFSLFSMIFRINATIPRSLRGVHFRRLNEFF